MSFILDALRKSESERQRSAVPGIAHAPLAVPRQSLPRWAVAVIALLGASVVAMGGAWWLARGTPAASPDVALRQSGAEATAQTPTPQAEPAGGSRDAPPTRLAPRPTTSPLRTAAAAARPAATPRAPAEQAQPRPAVRSQDPLPTVVELRERGVDLPELRLELHAYSETNRYVFINGKMYREGERLREGPELVAIEPRGAVLRHEATEFLLTQQ